jgi:nucleotide-binding universal stress UspA family protein
VKTILVGYDDTKESKRALLRAAEIAKAFDSSLHVTSVAPLLVGTPRMMGPYDPTEPPAEHAAQLEHAKALLAERGIEPTLEEAHGDPADMIVEVAERIHADLIVVGTHDRSLIERALGLSVSGAVARKAECDVLIVH